MLLGTLCKSAIAEAQDFYSGAQQDALQQFMLMAVKERNTKLNSTQGNITDLLYISLHKLTCSQKFFFRHL